MGSGIAVRVTVGDPKHRKQKGSPATIPGALGSTVEGVTGVALGAGGGVASLAGGVPAVLTAPGDAWGPSSEAGAVGCGVGSAWGDGAGEGSARGGGVCEASTLGAGAIAVAVGGGGNSSSIGDTVGRDVGGALSGPAVGVC